ncbi:hypothetical protein [Legionella spiritensis]|uniref:hypothetical protein n=1 Tax=Legionella spiritensis TaxID=452 RepID=UPI000F848711|nr:hypothetical protein [Legionella spiritensis]
MVINWQKNHIQNSNTPIQIIFHQEELDESLNENSFEIYVCVHGDYNSTALSNHSDESKATIIDIVTVSDRLNSDFLPVAYNISNIHMYCCGDQAKNKELARQLQSNLLRLPPQINYYDGCLYAPDSNGKQWSLLNNRLVPVHSVIQYLYTLGSDDIDDEITPQTPGRAIKSIEQWLLDCQKNKRNDFFSRNRNNRRLVLQNHRNNVQDDVRSDKLCN